MNVPSVPAFPPGIQTLAFKQLHRNEGLASVVFDGVNRADVGMIERRRGAGFEQKTVKRGGVPGKITGKRR